MTEKGLIPISLMVQPTQRCDRWCPFCSECSTPCGIDLDYAEVEELFRYLYLDNDFLDRYVVSNTCITGGGEPLLHPDLMTFIRVSALTSWSEVSLMTSGPQGDDEIRLMKEIASFSRKLSDGIWTGSDGSEVENVCARNLVPCQSLFDDPNSFARLENAVECSIPRMDLLHRQYRVQDDSTDAYFVELGDRRKVCRKLQSLGFVPEFWKVNLYDNREVSNFLRDDYIDEVFVDILTHWSTITWANKHDNYIVQPDSDYLLPLGRAMRLVKPTPSETVGRCSMTDDKGIQLRISAQGGLSLCHCANKDAYEGTVAGLKQALADADRVKREIHELLIADHSVAQYLTCEVCPLHGRDHIKLALP